MAFAILRTAKIKGAGNRATNIAHTYRERETPNANPEKTPENEILVKYDKEKCDRDIEAGRTRADNVETVEIILTTSPDWMDNATPEQKEQFKNKSQEFLEETFGKDNIQSIVLHKDEQTEHFHAHVTPIDSKGKLNAKIWLGGKQKLQELQEKFWQKVKDLGLERGERGSKAKHQTVAKYYARVNAPDTPSIDKIKQVVKGMPSFPEPTPNMSYEDYGKEVYFHTANHVIMPIAQELQAKTQELQVLKRERPRAYQKLKSELNRVKEENRDLKNICQKQTKVIKNIDQALTKNPALKRSLNNALELNQGITR